MKMQYLNTKSSVRHPLTKYILLKLHKTYHISQLSQYSYMHFIFEPCLEKAFLHIRAPRGCNLRTLLYSAQYTFLLSACLWLASLAEHACLCHTYGILIFKDKLIFSGALWRQENSKMTPGVTITAFMSRCVMNILFA